MSPNTLQPSFKQLIVRQAGTWDPLIQCCNTCTWTNVSLSNKIQRNYKRLKIIVCMCSWGKLRTRRYKKTKKPNCHFWRAGSKNRVSVAKAGYWECPLHSTPPKGWTKLLSYPFSSTHRLTSTYPHSIQGTSLPPPRGASKGNHYLFSLPPAAAGAPVKPSLNFWSGI